MFMEIDRVLADNVERQAVMAKAHLGHQGIVVIVEGAVPFRADPTEAPIDKEPEAAGMACSMVFLPDVGEIDVANPIVGVERHQEGAVADRNVTCYVCPPGPCGRADVYGEYTGCTPEILMLLTLVGRPHVQPASHIAMAQSSSGLSARLLLILLRDRYHAHHALTHLGHPFHHGGHLLWHVRGCYATGHHP